MAKDWKKKLAALPPEERAELLAALQAEPAPVDDDPDDEPDDGDTTAAILALQEANTGLVKRILDLETLAKGGGPAPAPVKKKKGLFQIFD